MVFLKHSDQGDIKYKLNSYIISYGILVTGDTAMNKRNSLTSWTYTLVLGLRPKINKLMIH